MKIDITLFKEISVVKYDIYGIRINEDYKIETKSLKPGVLRPGGKLGNFPVGLFQIDDEIVVCFSRMQLLQKISLFS